MKPLPLVVIAVAAFAGLSLLALRQRRRATTSAAEKDECAVSECSPDGTPLSLYAG